MATYNNIPAGASAPHSAPNENQTEALRSPRGRFLPGQSGNPNGRPRAETTCLRQRLGQEGETVADVVLGKAMAGDMLAAKLVLDRLLPPLRETTAPVRVDLPEAKGAYPIAETVLRAALSGTIPTDTAAQLVGIASQLCRISEAENFKDRLEALERAVTIKNPPRNSTRR